MTTTKTSNEGKTEQASVEAITRKVKDTKENAMDMIKKAGYDVGNVVEIMVDPQLPFMGYTMPRGNDNYRIVVSGMAVDSGLLEGLLVHEMSHVYRMRTRHPSTMAT